MLRSRPRAYACLWTHARYRAGVKNVDENSRDFKVRAQRWQLQDPPYELQCEKQTQQLIRIEFLQGSQIKSPQLPIPHTLLHDIVVSLEIISTTLF